MAAHRALVTGSGGMPSDQQMKSDSGNTQDNKTFNRWLDEGNNDRQGEKEDKRRTDHEQPSF